MKMKKIIGAYVIEESFDSFFNTGISRRYYKNGRVIAHSDEKGLHFNSALPFHMAVIITRSQGYNYWEKYFNGKHYLSLPEVLSEAVCLEDDSKVVCYWGHNDISIAERY